MYSVIFCILRTGRLRQALGGCGGRYRRLAFDPNATDNVVSLDGRRLAAPDARDAQMMYDHLQRVRFYHKSVYNSFSVVAEERYR